MVRSPRPAVGAAVHIHAEIAFPELRLPGSGTAPIFEEECLGDAAAGRGEFDILKSLPELVLAVRLWPGRTGSDPVLRRCGACRQGGR